jgi:Bacteriophage Sf6, terminase small subunit-like
MKGEPRYTRELADEICRRISSGDSLRKVCRDEEMPPEATVRNWARVNHDGFAARYHDARIMCVESWSDEMIDIAERQDLEPQDKRVRIDTLKWLASKLNPRRFGDRLLIDPESAIQHNHIHANLDAGLATMSPEQIDALERLARATLVARDGVGQMIEAAVD